MVNAFGILILVIIVGGILGVVFGGMGFWLFKSKQSQEGAGKITLSIPMSNVSIGITRPAAGTVFLLGGLGAFGFAVWSFTTVSAGMSKPDTEQVTKLTENYTARSQAHPIAKASEPTFQQRISLAKASRKLTAELRTPTSSTTVVVGSGMTVAKLKLAKAALDKMAKGKQVSPSESTALKQWLKK